QVPEKLRAAIDQAKETIRTREITRGETLKRNVEIAYARLGAHDAVCVDGGRRKSGWSKNELVKKWEARLGIRVVAVAFETVANAPSLRKTKVTRTMRLSFFDCSIF
ncbi:hypothetical protein, partial [Stieleria sp.]|uniref:hypothetical protein n=1 Tax=Stieleria sp. TaxID=2795976 RepID=UPI0035664790